jgi:hypothetical protein
VALLGLSLSFFSMPAWADDEAEARTKAAYLHNFTKFVEWPNLVNDTVHICVVGSEAIVNVLGEIASRDLKGHALQIWSGLDDPQICQILFISRVEKNLSTLMDQVRGNDVLTVSDMDGFARQGGGIGFYAEGGQIKLEINPEVTRNAHLRINAMLMEIARVVR